MNDIEPYFSQVVLTHIGIPSEVTSVFLSTIYFILGKACAYNQPSLFADEEPTERTMQSSMGQEVTSFC